MITKITDLNKQQKKILGFIEEYYNSHSYPPSIRDICIGVNISSTSVVVYHLKQLEYSSLIQREKKISRSIISTYKAQNMDSGTMEILSLSRNL